MSEADAPLVAVVHLGRRRARGAERRVRSWVAVVEAAGGQAVAIPLLPDCRRRARRPGLRDLVLMARSSIVPEALAWCPRRLTDRLDKLDPQLVICVSPRAYHPSLVGIGGVTALDYVDRLSVSYRDRSRLAPARTARALYRLLSCTMARFEATPGGRPAISVAAGWGDAEALGVTWVPIVTEPPIGGAPATTPDHDVLFFGTLSYPPNIAGLERLAALWPTLLARRPSISAIVAGSSPGRGVRRLVARCGWTLLEDFSTLDDLRYRARLAVAPLEHTAGLQIKVLDAATLGIAQVVTPESVAGFAPGFPAAVAADDGAFVDGVLDLLDDLPRATDLAASALRHTVEHYSAEMWAPWVVQTLTAPKVVR